MGGTYKKKLRAEKAKVKLKGAKLPKGLNVTKTEFKVRKIEIRAQLKESEYFNGERVFNLKESLSRLKHHSSNFRLEALRNIRDAITNSHPSLLNNLNDLIQNISAISLDVEKDTRRESFRALNSLLSLVSGSTVEPFFHIISSYLRCAMTHIQPAIQEDSLLMLDVLLEHIPELVASHNDKILKSFLEMISRARNEGDQSKRSLTVNMGGKQTSIKWRAKVLLRLRQMLQTLIQHTYHYKANEEKNNLAPNFQTRIFSEKEPQHYSLKQSYNYKNHCDFPFFLSRPENKMENIVTNTESQLQNYIEHLMPLLIGTWMEVRPQASLDGTQVLLSEESSSTLRIVLEIMDNLWNLVLFQCNDDKCNDSPQRFQREYADTFIINFVRNVFPYQQMENTGNGTISKKTKEKSIYSDHKCFQQNILITYFMCKLYTERLKTDSSEFQSVLQYLHMVLTNLSAFINENQRHLVLALRAILVDNSEEFLHFNRMETVRLLQCTIAAYMKNQFTMKDGVSTMALTILCDIVQSPKHQNAYGSNKFNELLKFLPKLLLRPSISENALISLSILGKQRNTIFLNSLKGIVVDVIRNLQKIQVINAMNAFEGKKHIANLYFWTEMKLNKSELETLHQNIKECITDKRIVDYFQYILKQMQ